MKIKPFAVVEAIAALIVLLVLLPGVFAQQYWDGPAVVPNVVEGGNGIWVKRRVIPIGLTPRARLKTPIPLRPVVRCLARRLAS